MFAEYYRPETRPAKVMESGKMLFEADSVSTELSEPHPYAGNNYQPAFGITLLAIQKVYQYCIYDIRFKYLFQNRCDDDKIASPHNCRNHASEELSAPEPS